MDKKRNTDRSLPYFACKGVNGKPALFMLLIFMLIAPMLSSSQNASKKTVALQIGLTMEDKYSDFNQYEISYCRNLPWSSNDGMLFSKIRFTGGVLSDGQKHSMLFSIGPVFGLHFNNHGIKLMAGGSAVMLGRSRFEQYNLGGKLQFINHIGLGIILDVYYSLIFGYQHMSNAGLHSPNPGLNLFFMKLCRHL